MRRNIVDKINTKANVHDSISLFGLCDDCNNKWLWDNASTCKWFPWSEFYRILFKIRPKSWKKTTIKTKLFFGSLTRTHNENIFLFYIQWPFHTIFQANHSRTGTLLNEIILYKQFRIDLRWLCVCGCCVPTQYANQSTKWSVNIEYA